ncbi:unnamed protein product [Somion occarium]|uniref:Major facilitator superfamily (MFS) profile domain-containing protein n=1 Tax=Somion occarium TaxID=3059160 RepID=A0ABP1DSW6_9APHY
MSTDVTNQRRTPFQLENLIASSGITNPESAESTRAATPLNPGTPVSEKETFVVNLSTENHPVLSQSEKPSLPHEGESAIPEDVQEEEIENKEDDWVHDPRNARNWPVAKKWRMVMIVSFYTLVPPLASSMMAPALPEIGEHFGITNPTVVSLTLSIFLITFALGPLILAPLSEIYGRTWILHICNILSLAFNLGCGFVKTTGSLIGLRILAGLAGSAPVAIGGGTISDCFSERDRSSAMAIYSLGPLIGPAVGPIAGGYIAQTVGYKYIFVVIAGLSGVCAAFGIPLLRETYGPVIRLRLIKKSGQDVEKVETHPHLVAAHGPGSQFHVLWVNLTRPFILLTRSAVCFLLSFYMALQYGFYYLMFATFPTLFITVYGFNTGTSGLAYIGLGVGFLASTMFGGWFGDKVYQMMTQRNGGKGSPEMRIPALVLGSLFPPIGLFWYGWSAQAQIHWIMPIIGTGVFGFGMMATFLPAQLYLVDSFQYAASALAAAAVSAFSASYLLTVPSFLYGPILPIPRPSSPRQYIDLFFPLRSSVHSWDSPSPFSANKCSML